MESTESARVAHCMVCGNEWIPRDATTKKPSRCSACRSRTVKWRDELTPDDLKAHDQYDIPGEEPGTPAPDTEPEPPEVEEPEGFILPDGSGVAFGVVGEPEPELSIEAIRRGLPSIPPQALVLILAAAGAVGAVLFLGGKAAKHSRTPPQNIPPQEERRPLTERELRILRQQQVDDCIRRRLAAGGQRA